MTSKRKYISLYVGESKIEWKFKKSLKKPKKGKTIKDENHNILTLKRVYGPYPAKKVGLKYEQLHIKFMKASGEWDEMWPSTNKG